MLVVLFISVADPDMGPGFRVHEIPFQFNLMKLLPRCQQVEMFFLMLTKGRCPFTTCLPLSSMAMDSLLHVLVSLGSSM